MIEFLGAVMICVAQIIYKIYIIASFISNVSILELLDFREVGGFNTRELSVFICIFIFIYIVHSKSVSVKKSIRSILYAFFVKDVVIVFTLSILHLLFLIILLYKIDLWKISLAKNSIIWLLFSASVTIFSINNIKNSKKYFSEIILDNFKISALIDFVTGMYTFNLAIELLLTSTGFIVGGMLAYSNEEKHKDVKKLLNITAFFMGVIILYNSLHYIIQNFSTLNVSEKVSEFSLPIILSLWFIPFFYSLYIYMKYELILISLSTHIKDKELLRFSKYKSAIKFGINIESLNRWIRVIAIESPKTKEDIINSIDEIKHLELIERNPPQVAYHEGWSPYKAKDFLKENGIETGFYNKCYENEWQASSSYVKLNDESIDNDGVYHLANNIAYYVSGNREVANQLKIVLNINSTKDEKICIDKFMKYVNILYSLALSEALPNRIINLIMKKKNISAKTHNKNILFKKQDYNNKENGYILSFTISCMEAA